MKVLKFNCGKYFYAFAAQTTVSAIQKFKEEIDLPFTDCEEIPESEWDEKIITMYEDNDFDKKPFKVSIREEICGTEPQLIFSNDYSLID